MSEQVVVPLGYAQKAIAPYAVLTITGKPDWDAISKEIEGLDALYDRLALTDDERRLADMQFPS
jgi:hypothetical protein